MDSSDPKSVVIEFFRRLENKDAKGAFELAGEDMRWWAPPGIPGAGGAGVSKEQELSNVLHLFNLIDGPFKQTITGITAQGERVAVEVEGGGKLRDGAIYAMTYHFLFIVRGGLIRLVKEYCDTAMTLKVWRSLTGQDAPAWS